jgi:methionyl-tRNA synthetase
MHRTLTLVLRYLTVKVPVWKAGGLFPEIEQLRAKVAHQSVAQMERLEFKESLETTWELVSALNRLIDEQKPWAMAKTPERAEELEQFFGIVFRSIRTLLLVLTPILPRACDLYWEQCGLPGQATLETFQALGEDFPEGVTVGQPQVVFPKLDLQRLEEEFIVRKESMTGETVERVEAAPVTVEAPKVVEAVSDECTYEDFLKVRLITCRVVKAEAVAGADKLLRLTVDYGKRKDRTIVSGIRVHFSPEQMEGKTIVVVDNLKPRKIFGILSEGMIMAGGDGTVLRLMTPDGELPPGTKLG